MQCMYWTPQCETYESSGVAGGYIMGVKVGKIKHEMNKIEAFEMKCIRRILKVSWTQKTTNEWVLETAEMERGLLDMIKRRKLSYFGHVMRKAGDCLKKESMQGRSRMRWMDNMEEWTGMPFEVDLSMKRPTLDPSSRGWFKTRQRHYDRIMTICGRTL